MTITARTVTNPEPDSAVRLSLAREALELHRKWEADSTDHSAWPVVMGRLVSSLELLVELMDDATG